MIRFSTAGESHGEALVALVSGIPAGVPVDLDFINRELWRRQQGYGRGGRMKIETDQAHIISGVRHGKTIGSPIAVTPDVIGIREPRKSDIIRPATDIVSAEIKIDTGNLITAFGQACSYKLFSHKSYIVIPKESSEEDVTRLDALGRIFGIGLILMDVSDPKMPRFEIRVRATKHEPDMFYVNKYMKLIENELFS